MYDSRNVTEDGQEDVDEQVGVAAALEEDTERREENGQDDFADIAVVKVSLAQAMNMIDFFKAYKEPSKGASETPPPN